jgi:hypothetical protein
MWNLELRDVHIEDSKVIVRYGSKGRANEERRIRRVTLFGTARGALARWLELLPGQPNPHKLVWPLPSGSRRFERPANRDFLKQDGHELFKSGQR